MSSRSAAAVSLTRPRESRLHTLLSIPAMVALSYRIGNRPCTATHSDGQGQHFIPGPDTASLAVMSDLALIGAISGSVAAVGAIVAAVGAWRTEITARWQARAERLRTDAARRENELHRARHAQLYQWWHDMPDGPARYRAMHWFGEWTGDRDPYHGSDEGS